MNGAVLSFGPYNVPYIWISNRSIVIVFKYLRCLCHWGMKYQAPGVSIGRLIIIWGSGREGREGSIAPGATSKSK